MHVGVVDASGALLQDCTHRILGNEEAFLERCRGEGLVQKQQALRRALPEELLETLALLSEPSVIKGLVLIRRIVREDAVHGNEAELRCGNEDPALCKHMQKPHCLRDRGLSAPVGAGQQIEIFFGIEIKVVFDNLICLFHEIRELEIVETLCLHPGPAFRSRQELCLAENKAVVPMALYVLRPAHVIEKFGNQGRDVHDRESDILIEHFLEVLHGLAQHMVRYPVHMPGHFPVHIVVRDTGKRHCEDRTLEHHLGLGHAGQPVDGRAVRRERLKT